MHVVNSNSLYAMISLNCGNCGSQVVNYMREEPQEAYLTMGTVDGNPDLPPGYHFFVASKAPWIEINDGLPQYDEWPPGDGPD